MRVFSRGTLSFLLPSLMSVIVCASPASAQTKVLSTPDSQVIDTTLRNGPYATINQNGPLLVTRSSNDPEWQRRTIISIDTTSIPEKTAIAQAILTLTLKSGLGASGTTRPITIYRLNSAFNEAQATWVNRQTGTAWSTPGGDLAEVVVAKNVTNVASAKVTFDVTAAVQRAINGEFGRQVRLALVDTGSDAKESYREYHSSESTTTGYRPQLSVTYRSGSATTIDVPAGGDLQTALNQIAPGGTIRLAAGATYTGNFKLPAKGSTSYVVITTNTTLPAAGTRIDLSYLTRLATIKSPNGAPALATMTAASYYKIIGVAFAANVNGDNDVIALGRDAQATLDEVPHHIEFDRIIISGDPAVGQRRALAVNAAHITIANSYIRDIKDAGYDSQAIAGWNTPGPITIKNNYLQAAGENILFGGSHINIPNAIPSDILIENNVLTKNPDWRGTSWTVKNLLELKNARRVKVRGNLMEYNWSGAQQGFAIVLTPRNSSGRTPWVTVEDVEFTGNVIRSVASVFNILGHDDTARSAQLARLTIRDNLAYDVHSGRWGGTGTFAQIGGEPRDITIDHNTVLHTGNIVLFYLGVYINSSNVKVTAGPIRGFVFTNNMGKHNDYGILGSGQSYGTSALNYYTPGYVVRRNVLASDKSVTSRYPADNFFPTVANFNAGFTDVANRDYRLVSWSPYVGAGTDGRDIGCAFAN
jgi:hypothetical protein